MILMALVDADYKFLWVDMGSNRSTCDAAVFETCGLKQNLIDGNVGLLEPELLPGEQDEEFVVPYFIVSDDAFPLLPTIMKPFSRRNLTDEVLIFNYRLSRARRVVENAFGIMANRYRCLLTTMQQTPDTVVKIVLACVIMHNLHRMRNPGQQNLLLDREGDNHKLVPGEWRHEGVMQEMEQVSGATRVNKRAKKQRIYLKHYLNTVAHCTKSFIYEYLHK